MSTAELPLSTGRKTYQDANARATRDQLIMDHLPLVRRILARLIVDFPSAIDRDNLESAGILGLLQAANQYDPSLETSFATFAQRRIRGEILDELRRNTPVPQRVFKNIRKVRRAMERLGYDATFSDIARDSELTEDLVAEALDAARVANIRHADDIDISLFSVFDWRAEQPGRPAEQTELKAALQAAIEQLDERERIAITLYYYEELTLTEIGELISMSEAGVSRLLARARYNLYCGVKKRGVGTE